jgi:outer membrane cobalamin receptor
MVYASYGRGFNSNFGATFENDPLQYARPNLVPTTLDSYEIGLKGQTANGVFRYELAAFYSEQANRRIFTPNPDVAGNPAAPRTLITFGDKLSVRGVEVALVLRPAKGTQVQINYSHVDGNWDRFTLSTFGGPVDLSGRAPVGVPRNTLFVSADQAITPWMSARAQLEVYDDYPVTLDNRVVAGGYEQVTLNLRIAPPMWKGVTVDLAMLNALGTEYNFLFGGRTDPTYATPGPPQQFRATIAKAF